MPPGRALAREDAAPATSERQQHACTDEVERNATLHARKNASSFFNGVSTLAGDDFVKDKDSLISFAAKPAESWPRRADGICRKFAMKNSATREFYTVRIFGPSLFFRRTINRLFIAQVR
jgi:hypothetical protein